MAAGEVRPEYADAKLSENLLRLLGERDWTQTQLATYAGVTAQCVGGMLNRKHGSTLRSLRAVHDALGCTWDELLE